MKKTKKLLMFVSVILCLSMLFAACDGKGDKNKDGTESTTTATVQSNNSPSRENTAADIKMLVEYFNSTEAAALNSDIFENIDKTIYSYISRAKVGLSNIEINNEKVLDKMTLDGGNVYVEIPEQEFVAHFQIDETLLVLGLMVYEGEPISTLILDQFQSISEAYDGEILPDTDIPEFNIPKIESSDFIREGSGLYSINKSYFVKYCSELLASIATPDEISEEDMEQVKEFFEKFDFKFKYKVSEAKIVSSETEINIPSDVIADLAEKMFDVPRFADEEYSFKYKLLADYKNDAPMIKELDCDMYFPISSLFVDDDLYVDFIDCEMNVDINANLLLNNADIFNCKLDTASISRQYTKKGDAYEQLFSKLSSSIDLTTSLSKGKFLFDLTQSQEGTESFTKMSADVDFETVSIPELDKKSQNYVEKFKAISRDKKRIDAYIDLALQGVESQLTHDLVAQEIDLRFNEYDIVVTLEVILDENGDITTEVNRYSFYSIDGFKSKYRIVERSGGKFTIEFSEVV